MIDRNRLHKAEMRLIGLCDDFVIQNEEVTMIKKVIIDVFTDLMSEV